ncbi:Lymphoid-specific helicase [Ceratocystis lukuohia]|uniref:Lymphoid-specific helicase n=1 Tax=Ceratocystis lukuohia TaxID=2019550 RepID=A0ABR4MFN8_9PEZI
MTAIDLDTLQLEEEKARLENEATRSNQKAKRKPHRTNSKKEREDKARELDALLRQTEAFSNILTAKTKALGRVGTGFDGQSLGEHKLAMAEQPRCMVGGTMRDYQLEGLTWMYEICEQGMSGILADEMGLGKTVQTISLIALLREKDNYFGPHLIIAPLSTLSNWMKEFEHWVPSIPVIMYHGTPPERADVWAKQVTKNYKSGRPTAKFPVICTSYEVILRDRAVLSKIQWEFIIIDEGHRMKNFDSKLFRELKTFQSATRLLITGTPLQNSLKELWSLLNFLLPHIFTDWDAFDTWFDFSDLQDEEGTEEFITNSEKHDIIKKIHVVLQPLLLRRVKADVAAYLPKKREYILYAPMTKEQTDLYRAINDKDVDTREFLQNKVMERLAKEETPKPRRSTRSQVKNKQSAENHEEKPPVLRAAEKTLAIRQSPAKKANTDRPAKNAFSMLMGNKTNSRASKATSKTEVKPPLPPPPPPAPSKKRKAPVVKAEDDPEPKSARSSRQSTPAGGRPQSRLRRGAKSYKESEIDDDALSDDQFEAELAKEMQVKEMDEIESVQNAEDFEFAKTLELAKKEVSSKKLGNPIMQLRLVCNSPHNFYYPWNGSDPADETIVTASGKMLLLDRLLPALFQDNHKVLIFSQFKSQLNLLEEYCALRDWECCRLDGSVAQSDRQAMIADFTTRTQLRIFLLSTRAGGQGINLMAADTVILFDSDWNPQQDLQAQDRAHRIGQKNPVLIFRLATRGTVEETLLTSADAKRRLEKLIIKKGNLETLTQSVSGQMSNQLDKETLRSLLLKDGRVYEYSGGEDVLSDADVATLCDRSDEAYEKASKGGGNADAFTVVETGVNGIRQLGKEGNNC